MRKGAASVDARRPLLGEIRTNILAASPSADDPFETF
jgi:hypothetical protein